MTPTRWPIAAKVAEYHIIKARIGVLSDGDQAYFKLCDPASKTPSPLVWRGPSTKRRDSSKSRCPRGLRRLWLLLGRHPLDMTTDKTLEELKADYAAAAAALDAADAAYDAADAALDAAYVAYVAHKAALEALEKSDD